MQKIKEVMKCEYLKWRKRKRVWKRVKGARVGARGEEFIRGEER